MSAPTIKDPKTRAIIGYNPPKVGQKFRFKPDTVVEFREVDDHKHLQRYISPIFYIWVFRHQIDPGMRFTPEEIIEYLTDKHLKPI